MSAQRNWICWCAFEVLKSRRGLGDPPLPIQRHAGLLLARLHSRAAFFFLFSQNICKWTTCDSYLLPHKNTPCIFKEAAHESLCDLWQLFAVSTDSVFRRNTWTLQFHNCRIITIILNGNHCNYGITVNTIRQISPFAEWLLAVDWRTDRVLIATACPSPLSVFFFTSPSHIEPGFIPPSPSPLSLFPNLFSEVLMTIFLVSLFLHICKTNYLPSPVWLSFLLFWG